MSPANELNRGPSRRHLLAGGLAGGLLLTFRVPVRAANEPAAMAYAPEGPFAPNAFIRIHVDHAAGRDGAGHLHGGRHDPC